MTPRPPGVHRGHRGTALLVAMLLLAFLAMMITAVLQSNVTLRRQVRRLRDRSRALALAESAVEEAVHAMAAQGSAAGTVARTVGVGSYEARWKALKGTPGTVEITAWGAARADDPKASRHHLQVRARQANDSSRGAANSASPRSTM